jgi:phosphoribosyl 1,2-cyclic phosphodiesterase
VRATIWGCRGSLATPGRETVRTGGNTSCIEIRPSSGDLLILDAGTGIRGLGVSLDGRRPRRVDLLLSHLHLDHLEGLPFFAPLWDPDTEFHIWGPSSPVTSLEDRIATYLSPPLFPVHLSEVPSALHFHDAPSEPWELGSCRLCAVPIAHPGPTLGYRFEEGSSTFAYLTDHEPALGLDLRAVAPEWISGYSIAFGADVLLHDCQYTEDEYAGRVGWFADRASVGRLLLFHHDPMHGDDDLDRMAERVDELWDGGPTEVAREGLEIEL